MSGTAFLLLADLVLVVHVAFAGFIVLGLAAIWAGRFLGWGSIRNRTFRLGHLAAMGCVALESVMGIFCPLTEWEDRLRILGGEGERYGESFLVYWLGKVLYRDWSEATFLALYLGLFMLILLTWRIVPPRSPRPSRPPG